MIPSVISEIERVGRQACAVQRGSNAFVNLLLAEVARRKVDADSKVGQPEDAHRSGVRAGLMEHPLRDVENRPDLLRDSDETVRLDDAQQRMVPAQQRLGGDDPAGLEIDDRLIENGELAARQRLPQIQLEAHPFENARVHRVAVKLCILPARIFRAIHRRVGLFDEFRAVGRVLRKQTRADARRNRELAPFERNRLIERA